MLGFGLSEYDISGNLVPLVPFDFVVVVGSGILKVTDLPTWRFPPI